MTDRAQPTSEQHDRIFVTRRIPAAGLRLLDDAGAPCTVGQSDDERDLDRDALLAGVAAADVLLCLLTESIDREVLTANPRLRGVANYAVGYNNVDVSAATELGIPVSNTPGVLTETTADLTWALLLALARRIPEADAYMRAGRYGIWGPNLLLGSDVGPGPDGQPKTLGIIGYGRIGAAVARRARGFDMRVLAWTRSGPAKMSGDSNVEYADLQDVLAHSDYVSVHVALAPETRHLIDAAALRAMKPSAYLINTTRGEVVDERALVQALREGWIAGAGLDVYEDEPRMVPGLADAPNTVLLPHIGSATRDTRDRMAIIAATNALAHLRRERAPDCINPDVYDTAAYRERQ